MYHKVDEHGQPVEHKHEHKQKHKHKHLEQEEEDEDLQISCCDRICCCRSSFRFKCICSIVTILIITITIVTLMLVKSSSGAIEINQTKVLESDFRQLWSQDYNITRNASIGEGNQVIGQLIQIDNNYIQKVSVYVNTTFMNFTDF